MAHALPGCIELHSGKIKESIPYFKRWLQQDSYSPFTRFWCASAFAFNNNIKENIEVLDSIIRDTPDLIFAKFARFFKSALLGDKENALRYATEDMKREAAHFDYLPRDIAWGYALIDEKEEAMNWLEKTLDFGNCPYPLLEKFDIFHRVLKDHPDFILFMEDVKRRSEEFEV